MIISFFDTLYLKLLRRYTGAVPSILEYGPTHKKRSLDSARWGAQRTIGSVVGGAWFPLLAWGRVLVAGRDPDSVAGTLVMMVTGISMLISIWRMMNRYQKMTERVVALRIVRSIGRESIPRVWCIGWILYSVNLGVGLAAIMYLIS